jgi:hypothetical protein
MIGNLIGAAIGRAIDRRDGEGGLAGAAIGALSVSVIRRTLPLALVVGGAYALIASLKSRSADA